jgi:hypothetical protein
MPEGDWPYFKKTKKTLNFCSCCYGDIIYSVIFFSECDICDKYIRR